MAALLTPLSAADIPSDLPPHDWLWDGVLARGMVTLLTSRWKAGKTTLVSLLLARMGRGGNLAGTPVAPADAVVLSEEPPSLWRERDRRLHFGPGIRFCCRPFRGRPSYDEWSRLVIELAEARPGLVVLDPLAMFLPGNLENHATALLAVLEPLHRFTDAGTAVLLLHHPRKASTGGDLVPRGTGALTGFVDILAELDRPATAESDRVRRLKTASRIAGTTARLIELAADGDDYLPVADAPDPFSYELGWPIIQDMVGGSLYRSTRIGLWKKWPVDFDKPSLATLRRWLDRAAKEGMLVRTGTGRYGDAYRYALPGQHFPMDDFEIPRLDPPDFFPKPKKRG